MSVEEIFAALSARMVEGMMYHDQMSRYYGFLGLFGYRLMHDTHYADETMGYRDINAYYCDHYCKLIPERRVADPHVIPDGWYPHSRRDVDPATRRKAVQTGAEGWVAWETETKALYEKAAKDLYNLGEIASYRKVMDYVKDVDYELACANKELITLEAVSYDLPYIVDYQDALTDTYGKKISNMKWNVG